MKNEGVKSLFKGAGANILRAVAGAGVLSGYDQLQVLMFGKHAFKAVAVQPMLLPLPSQSKHGFYLEQQRGVHRLHSLFTCHPHTCHPQHNALSRGTSLLLGTMSCSVSCL